MTESNTADLLQKYQGTESEHPSSAAELHQKILNFKPDWTKYQTTGNSGEILKLLDINAPASKTKVFFMEVKGVLQACMSVCALQDVEPMQWVLTLLSDLLRADTSCYSVFEATLKTDANIFEPLKSLLSKKGMDSYVVDKAAWLVSSLMCHLPRFFNDDDTTKLLTTVLGAESTFTEVGKLEVITNLLKAEKFRSNVWSHQGVSDVIFNVQVRTAPAPQLYRCMFAVWMLSFDVNITEQLKEHDIVLKIHDILTYNRVEKVVRICLTAMKNLLKNKSLCEEIVEQGILEAVQQLEFEKWRDPELYDDIRDMLIQISCEVSLMSNYDRYVREIESGKLAWGFIHSSKFWNENIMKFETNDYRALKMLAGLLNDKTTDAMTLAVACHDFGEFVTLHPLGKRKVAELRVKERVMELMSSPAPSFREVRREALLCCQKIMLNKWQDMEKMK